MPVRQARMMPSNEVGEQSSIGTLSPDGIDRTGYCVLNAPDRYVSLIEPHSCTKIRLKAWPVLAEIVPETSDCAPLLGCEW